MAFCRVSYKDIDAVRHEVQVQADSLYEAVAEAVAHFRKNDWAGCPPGPGCEFTVEVRPEPAMRYTIALSKVKDHARFSTARGASDIPRKRRLRELLGIEEDSL